MSEERRKENQTCSHDDLRAEIRNLGKRLDANNDMTAQLTRAVFGEELTKERGLVDKLDDLRKDMDPVIQAFRDDQGFGTKISNYVKYIGWGTAILVGIKLLGGDIIKIFSK